MSIFLKTIIVILILTFTTLLLLISSISCSDNTVSNNTNPNVVTSVSGVINDLPSHSPIIRGLVVKDTVTYVAAEHTVGTNNNFEASLNIPPANALYNLRDIITQLGEGITYTNSDTKGNYLNFYAFNSITLQSTGSVVRANSSTFFVRAEGNYHLTYLYCDRNVDISGSSVNIFNTDTIKYNFSLSMSAGYNRITTRFKTIRNNYTEFEVFSGEPVNASWYYVPQINYTQIKNLMN